MNSPATALFDKSNSLYGLYQAREAISLSGTAIVAEGYTDVMMAHQFGFENVVAALGTSLTDGHVKILRRYAKRIVLLFDSDVAGKAAANRALEVCLGQKIDVRLAFVPAGKDPCEYLLEAGAEAFRKVIETSEDVLEFKWKVLSEQLEDGQNLSDRTEAIRRFLQTAAGAFEARQMDSISRAVVVSRLSELLGISSSRIEEEITVIQQQKRRSQRSKEDVVDQAVQGADESVDLVSKSQREILEVLLENPTCFEQVAERISAGDFGPDERLIELAEAVFGVLTETGGLRLSQVYARIQSPQTANLLTHLQTLAEHKQSVYSQLEGALEALEKQRYDSHIQKLKESLDGDDELKQIQQQIARKGPNLRNAGLY
jgi:DNA primase